jgi:hypothetical protein
MLVTTHAVVASTVAIKTGNPYLYIPFAMVDHFLLDTFPHFGGKWVKKRFRPMVVLDVILGITLFLILARYTQFSIIILFAVCLLAGWPDLILVYRKFISPKVFPRFGKFHSDIQKFESFPGVLIEIVIVLGCLWLIFE